ncbi:MAG: hypothetical protein ACLQIB_48060 [Isosphaeraceae bacterium]
MLRHQPRTILRQLAGDLLERAFDGSTRGLLLHALEHEKAPSEEVASPELSPVKKPASPWPRQMWESWTEARNWLEDRLVWVAAGWLLGICLLSVRLLVGWAAIERLKRVGVHPITDDLWARLENLARRLRNERRRQGQSLGSRRWPARHFPRATR